MASKEDISLAGSVSLKNIKHLKQSAAISISPEKQFYEIFREDEIVEIIIDLKFKRLIKLKYRYFQKGSEYWDKFYFESPVTPVINGLKEIVLDNVLYFVSDKHLVNLVDIGPGNGYPVKSWLQRLNDLGILNSYVCVDISQDINNLVEKNMREWFPTIPVYKYQADIEQTDIAKFLIKSKFHNELGSDKISNILLLLGNTICNFADRREVLKNFARSMDINDLLVISYSTDVDRNKLFHQYTNHSNSKVHDSLCTWIPKMLGFDSNNKNLVTEYDDKIKAKVKSLKLTKNYVLTIRLFNQEVKIAFSKGEKINLWKHYLINEDQIKQEFDEVGLELVFQQYDLQKSVAIVVCRIKDVFNQRNI